MKTTNKTFDAVGFMRQQRDLLSTKLSKMTKEEIIVYFKNRALQSHVKPLFGQGRILSKRGI